MGRLSVSSNGSTWVKLKRCTTSGEISSTFSILERIDVGETKPDDAKIAERIEAFSILERIDVGETSSARCV